jgi:type II restriction enzyme
MYELNKQEQKILDKIEKIPYMVKTIKLIEDFVCNHKNQDKSITYKAVFDEIFQILTNAKPFVDDYLSERKQKGEIKDEKQAMKSIAGNSFSQAIVYIFLQNKKFGNIRSDIYMTSEKSKVPSFEDISTINVDGETQKPDCDLIIYSLKDDKILKGCIILSLKTSLRERAGQTYRWKLLMEIATSENSIKEKYNISYNPQKMKMPLVCFATVNFYNEINNPQSRGMFKFFDKSFIAKNVDNNFISRMSECLNYLIILMKSYEIPSCSQ